MRLRTRSQIGLEATKYFDLNQDPAVLKPFDNKYGTRTYRDKTGEYHQAWEGDLVRHEALHYRVEVKDLRRCAVAAA
jgi:hypothetical protein